VRVFDVNLRQTFFSKKMLLVESMRLAEIVKVNHEELPRMMELFWPRTSRRNQFGGRAHWNATI